MSSPRSDRFVSPFSIMRSAESGDADFSAMDLRNQRVEKFKHKTMVEVNEEGAEAAAVTAVMLGRSLPTNVQINRPFFWAIRDNRSRALIFAGLMLDPN